MECATHTRVAPWIRADDSPSIETFKPDMGRENYYLTPGKGGFFMFHPLGETIYEIHCCLTPSWWGKKAIETARQAMKWMIENTPCRVIQAFIPANNTLAIRLAKNTGMRYIDTIEKSFLKNGALLDRCALEITEEDICRF